MNLLWLVLSNFFDRHATFCTVDKCGASSGTVKSQRQVHLFHDVDLLDKVYSVDWETISSTLVSNKSISKHLAGHVFSLVSVVDEVDTTLETGFFEVTHTTATSKNLRLDDASAVPFRSNFESLIRGESNTADGDWHLE